MEVKKPEAKRLRLKRERWRVIARHKNGLEIIALPNSGSDLTSEQAFAAVQAYKREEMAASVYKLLAKT